MSARTALLLLNSASNRCNSHINAALKLANTVVSERLYVHIYSSVGKENTEIHVKPTVRQLLNLSSRLYASASCLVPSLDVTVLQRYHLNYQLGHTVELLLLEHAAVPQIRDSLIKSYQLPSTLQVLEYTAEDTGEAPIHDSSLEIYDHTALGGTFDSIHNGHKVLLGAGIAMSKKSLTIGVTDKSMNKNKTLKELMSPVEERKANVQAYVEEVRPDISYQIVTLHDPFGPTVTDESLECLVVSEETTKGGDSINHRRVEKGFPEMAIHCIELVADSNRSQHQEHKISSSNMRERKLGTLLRPTEPRPKLSPYRIGLTGGIASGKSSVGKRLESLGAGLINSDLLAHEVYRRGSETYDQVVETFGKSILHPKTGEIVRQRLGAIVFADESAREKLNSIVWPATGKLVDERLHELDAQGKKVCYIEAALLLEAGWQSRLHEVWSCILPKEAAVHRLKERNNMSEEEALQRINSQVDDEYRVERSNVVLCTLWDYSVTQTQVEKAWTLLQKRLP